MIDELIKQARKGFGAIKDHRKPNAIHPLVDLLSAGFAVFSLKDPSLLSFRHQFPRRSENLKRVYGIEQIPEDTALREQRFSVWKNFDMSLYKQRMVYLPI
jgi:hypothetical protein